MNKIILNKRILIIEDYKAVVDLLKQELSNYIIENEATIEGAINNVESKGYDYYDVYLLDYMLEDSVGSIFLAKLASKIKGAVITFSSEMGANKEMMNFGADFLESKNDVDKVISLIKNILEVKNE